MSDPTSAGRNIVILMDGTANEYSMTNTNIIKLASVLQVNKEQLMYYDSGVGTTLPAAASTWSDIRRGMGIAMDEAFAWNFPEHVQSAYRYLMETYQSGDRIYIFGFSRGSYSARCLAGMIEKVGLLPAGNNSQIPIAYKLYKDKQNVFPPSGDNAPQLPGAFPESLAHGYKRTFGISKTVKVHFLGVYDTVASLGLLDVKELPFASNVDMVSFFRQALALNERRAKFQPVYRHPDVHVRQKSPGVLITWLKGLFGRLPVRPPTDKEAALNDKLDSGDTCGHRHAEDKQLRTKEVWFLGCHSDVGGGNDRNDCPSLSNISFRWMVREAEHCGLKLDPANVLLQLALMVPPVTEYIAKELPLQITTDVDTLRENLSNGFVSLNEHMEVRTEIRELLTPDKVHHIVNLAAGYDTSQDYFQPERINAGEEDLKRLPKESLTWPWWILEWMVLQTRNYAGGAGGRGDHGGYSWRINFFRYRQMLPGRLQRIHRSVQRKLQYDAHFGKKVDAWTKPKNCLPKDWKVTWEELGTGKKEPGGGWEN